MGLCHDFGMIQLFINRGFKSQASILKRVQNEGYFYFMSLFIHFFSF